MTSLEQIRKKLVEKREAQTGGDKTLYMHWELPDNGNSVVRFLPDGNADNVFFWVEKQIIKMPFSGVKGQSSDSVVVQVPCVEMWGRKCPVMQEIRKWFNTDMDSLARTYWKKRSYIFQGFVRQDGIPESEKPENPIRKFIISPQIFKIIETSLIDPEFEHLQVDYEHGTDFIINKTVDGDYANYTTSRWARKESPLTSEELEAIEKFGLPDLSSYLPEEPTEKGLEVIYEMFEASVEGKEYDPEKWGKYYRPRGVNIDSNMLSSNSSPKLTHKTAPNLTEDLKSVISDNDESVVSANNNTETSSLAESILERLERRNA